MTLGGQGQEAPLSSSLFLSGTNPPFPQITPFQLKRQAPFPTAPSLYPPQAAAGRVRYRAAENWEVSQAWGGSPLGVLKNCLTTRLFLQRRLWTEALRGKDG